MHLEEKRLKSETVYEGLIFNITHDTVLLENEKTAFRDVLWHHGGVCVIPVTDDNEIYLVKQFRYPFSAALLEVPAGKLEKGEDPSLKGDVNVDGAVDIADGVSILNVMASGEALVTADVNGDGAVDIADFVSVLNIMAGVE